MKQRHRSMVGCLLVGLLVLPAWAQQSPSYREPLAATTTSQAPAAHPSTTARQALPAFAVEPGSGERFSREALTFVSRAAVQVASERTRVATPVASPSYQPYRPGVSVPEPATTERYCPPLGAPNPSAACIAR